MSVETLIRWEVRLGRLHWAVKLAATLAIVVVVSTVRWVLREWLTLLPFLPYFPVVVVCAVLFGRRYAYGASTIGFFIALYYFVPPEFSFDVGAEAWGSSLLFLLVLVFTGWSVGTLKHFADRLYAAERAKALSREGSSKPMWNRCTPPTNSGQCSWSSGGICRSPARPAPWPPAG